MAQIPNFTDEVFNDEAEFKRQLTAVLKDLNKDANKPTPFPLKKNGLYIWVDDGETPIPQGYAKADGKNMTFDASVEKLIYLQKVS